MPSNYQILLQIHIFNNPIEAYLFAVLVTVAVWVGLWAFRNIILRRLRKWAERTSNDLDDLLVEVFRSFRTPFYALVALGAGAQFIEWPPFVSIAGYWAAGAVIAYTVIRAITQLVDFFFSRAVKKRLEKDPRFDVSAVGLLAGLTKLVVWIVALLLIAQNLGYNITALVAGLGIGGLAVAFALQNVLSDIFASFSIYLDRPFQTGDFIIVGDMMGIVKHIGIKSTRIESLWGEEIIVSNKDLTEARVKNYKRMESRRIVFQFGVTYQTTAELLRNIPKIVEDIIGGIELAELNRVHWKEFGDSALVFEVMYSVSTREYNEYMDVQQEINLQLKERLEKEGIEFAFPTQTLFVHQMGKGGNTVF